jgi:hypothetical protein
VSVEVEWKAMPFFVSHNELYLLQSKRMDNDFCVGVFQLKPFKFDYEYELLNVNRAKKASSGMDFYLQTPIELGKTTY